jgi:hypothetical protein
MPSIKICKKRKNTLSPLLKTLKKVVSRSQRYTKHGKNTKVKLLPLLNRLNSWKQKKGRRKNLSRYMEIMSILMHLGPGGQILVRPKYIIAN